MAKREVVNCEVCKSFLHSTKEHKKIAKEERLCCQKEIQKLRSEEEDYTPSDQEDQDFQNAFLTALKVVERRLFGKSRSKGETRK